MFRIRVLIGSLVGAFFQILTSALNRVLFRYFLRLEIKHAERLRGVKGPLLIVANHVSRLDPFLIGTALPFFSPLFPIRFATAPEYYCNPFLFPFLWLLAGFPVRKGIGLENSLKTPLALLAHGQVVGWFPEGKIRRMGRPPKGRRGVGYLGLHGNASILPVRIDGIINLEVTKFFTRRTKAVITIGEIFTVPAEIKASVDLNATAEFISALVFSLSEGVEKIGKRGGRIDSNFISERL